VNSKAEKLFQRSIRFLSYRDRSEKEIIDYLKNKLEDNDDENLIVKTIERLKDHGLVDDVEFAGKWVRARYRRGKGPKRIWGELYKKGIDRQIITNSLKKMVNEEEWLESAGKLVEKRIDGWSQHGYLKKRDKLLKFLLYRGFPLGMAKKAIDQLIKPE
jgi:regulatory protein